MVILNNLGVTIDRASQIGADDARTRQGIEQVRAFMNLAEDPIVSGVSALASADVAVDFVFDILPSAGPAGAAASNEGTSEQEAASRPTVHSALQSLPAPVTPISARIMSYPGRPVDRAALRLAGKPQLFPTPARRSRSRPPGENEVGSSVGGSPAAGCSPTRGRADGAAAAVRLSSRDGGSRGGAPPKGPLESLGDVVRQMQEKLGAAAAAMREPGGDSNTGQAPQTLSDALAGAVDSSMLAIAIKNELVKLQSNVSSFLAPDHDKHASALIIHFHGGGFVSQSSAGHAVYLKEWAADVPDAVILSVDYKLAPENPYPAALNDCLYAYFWALENATALGTTAERVVLCGDSAGGNLAVAVALKARAHGLRVADGICLAYPALYVNVAWSPSRLLSFFDPLLPLSILDLCLRAYVPEGAHPHKDPFISPLVASPDALRALPPISLVAGALDPLLDDSVQFMHNLRRSGREGDTFRIMETLPHGFLNMVQVSRDARDACSFLSRHLADMLHVSTRRRGEVGRGGSGGGGGGGVGGGGGGRSTTAGGGGAATTPQVFDN
jgi:acetyl esterase/lipase